MPTAVLIIHKAFLQSARMPRSVICTFYDVAGEPVNQRLSLQQGLG